MNILEKITKNNENNHALYLSRMTNNLNRTTKMLFPLYALNAKSILDVGCGSGILIQEIAKVNPNAEIIGIDINQFSIEYCQSIGIQAYHMSLEQMAVNKKWLDHFDCIIFSSVLHEISSYAEEKIRYTECPIVDALKIAKTLLKEDGTILVRDGLAENREETCCLRFKSSDVYNSFIRFLEESPIVNLNSDIKLLPGFYAACMPIYVAQLFCSVYTWGPESWAREINECYCILNEKEWISVFESCGFDVNQITKSQEEYPQYLYKDVAFISYKEFFPYMTIFIVAHKHHI